MFSFIVTWPFLKRQSWVCPELPVVNVIKLFFLLIMKMQNKLERFSLASLSSLV
jgi:hypothetical protein